MIDPQFVEIAMQEWGMVAAATGNRELMFGIANGVSGYEEHEGESHETP